MKHFQLFTKRWQEKLVTGLDLKRVWRSWWQKVPHRHHDQVSRAGRRGEKAVPAADGKKNHVACPICRWLSFVLVFVSWTKYVWKNVTYEHKNFIDDHQLIIARSLWPMITIIYALHVSMMYFILYEICQIDYPEKWGQRYHFVWMFHLKYFIEYELHHRILHECLWSLIITFKLWSMLIIYENLVFIDNIFHTYFVHDP